ncbi:hypothetical protein Taro_019488 [Colocasia esculenta]|uniref:Uncharacterized protein n=1 Tax=Colocasia esculenta TaxID=4460 RepID=A0A843UTL1_COLES|nr:hypothetical protein [Colocasia esculenta]
MWCVLLYLHGLWFGIPCEASARSREADSDQVRYRFNGLGRGVPPQGQRALGRRRSGPSRPGRDATMHRVSNRCRFLNNPSQAERTGVLLDQGEELWRFQLGFGVFGVSSLQGVREKQGKRWEIAA